MRVIALVLVCLGILYLTLALALSVRGYSERIKQEREQRIEKLESQLIRGCGHVWPLRGEHYEKCLERVQKRLGEIT